MKVNPQQILDNGFIILRDVIPPERLNQLRDSFELTVERQKAIWAQNRKPDAPPGGEWETSPQPRVMFSTVADQATADTIEFCLHENTRGVSRQLMRSKEATVTLMSLMCNPVRDHGPSNWHRDIHPIDQAPLGGLQTDMLENAPGYVQWNIPLYDDDVLWVVPGSHRRSNTDPENRQLLENNRVPLPGGIPVELKAGDGVAYTNTMFHWGSNYSPQLRRTIHLGYRAFGGPVYPYVPHPYWRLDFGEYLSPWGLEIFEGYCNLLAEECDRIVSVFHAMVDKDSDAFREGIAALHPGEEGRMVCVALLSKFAHKIRFEPPGYGGDITRSREIGNRLSPEQIETLWNRFAPLDAKLQSDTEQFLPGFQSAPMRYYFYEMPSDFNLEDFIASWDAG